MSGDTMRPPPSKPDESPLARLVQIASALGAAKVADEAFELADRVASGRFFCACVGQHKRGKSAFLNALIGEAILPVGVAPVTSAITVILHGKRRSARVRFHDGNVLQIPPGELRDYVAEQENPGNAKQVATVELSWPSPLLAGGLCLVDTPGLGSTHTWSTELTRAFVPQVDAAVVLLGADPPLSELELELVEQLSRQTTTLLFALNKADRMAREELDEAREFTRKALRRRLACADLRVHEVSSTERLRDGPTREWTELERELTLLAQGSARALVQRAQQRGMERFAGQLRHEVSVRLEALRQPVREQDARLDTAEAEIAQAERTIPSLFMESAEDQLRMEGALERRKESFIKDALPHGRAELERALAGEKARGPALRAAGVQHARRIALALMDEWSRELSRLIEQSFGEVMERMLPCAHGFVRKVSPSSMAALRELRRGIDTSAGPPLPPALAEPVFRPSRIPEAALWTEAGAMLQVDEMAGYLRRLVDTSAVLMARQARERYREKQRALEADLRRWMGEMAQVGARAVQRSRDMHRAGSEAVQAEMERIRQLLPELDALVALQAERTAAAVAESQPKPSRGPGGAVGLAHELAVRVSSRPPPPTPPPPASDAPPPAGNPAPTLKRMGVPLLDIPVSRPAAQAVPTPAPPSAGTDEEPGEQPGGRGPDEGGAFPGPG